MQLCRLIRQVAIQLIHIFADKVGHFHI